jgi:dTDP-4-dehydrorhamnose reductase
MTVEGADLPELWGGVECTVNRVGDRWFDQLARSGHRERLADLDRFASLGIRALRVPVLWETVRERGWEWATAVLTRLRRLGVRPIVGLVHHGSGPPGTSLLEESFVEGLAAHAREVAERFPFVEDWTPVNEPLTTARFSALYGHWYPHAREDASFTRALLVQTRATRRAMAEIRSVSPGARLVQTEDMGRTTGSHSLREQIDFENERRWLSLDLLCGRVRSGHPLWEWLLASGVDEGALQELAEQPLPPDVVGLNYYVTSDRWLDERPELHPPWSHGGNGERRYADVHTSLGRPSDLLGHRGVLLAAWNRYRLPVALTEVHQGCHRADQLRWLAEAWRAAVSLRAEGVDVRAVTLWALLGSHDWNCLVVEERGHYESGVFDVRAPEPRPTALAGMARALASTGGWEHPVLAETGWWRGASSGPDGPPLLIVGGRSALGSAIRQACEERRVACIVQSPAEGDLLSEETVRRAWARHRPWAVVHVPGPDHPEVGPRSGDRLVRTHVHGSEMLARIARDVPLVHFSSDQVFSSPGGALHAEGTEVAPRSALGILHLEAERRILAAHLRSLVIRIGPLFGAEPGDRPDLDQDTLVTPLFLPDLAETVLDLLLDSTLGVLHLSHGAAVTGRAWRRLLSGGAGDAGEEPAPLQSRALVSERLWPMPSLADVLARWSRVTVLPRARTG